MQTECSAERFDFGEVEGRAVEAAFDAGLVTSDAGALLLGATDRAIDLVGRFADCFRDHRRQDLIEHAVGTLIGQRVFGIALGYEDLNDHDELRHDPLMAVLAGKLEARREDCAPVAGKSTLNRLELSREEPSRYHKIAYDAAAIEALPVRLFLDKRPLEQIIYCARGDMENRIKECQLDLYADRTSAQTMRANQLRLWFASMAYVLICALRRIGLAETTFADATCGTIRLKLLKIGALVRISCRRIKIAMASACPAAEEWGRAARRLAEATKARASPA